MTRKVKVVEQAQFPSLKLSLVRIREITRDGREVYNIHLVDGRREYMNQLFNVERTHIQHVSRSSFDEWKEVLEWIVEGENYLSLEQQSKIN